VDPPIGDLDTTHAPAEEGIFTARVLPQPQKQAGSKNRGQYRTQARIASDRVRGPVEQTAQDK